MSKPLLIFVVTEDWYFYSHRRPTIKAAQSCGYRTAVITNIIDHKALIEDLGVEVYPFSFERRSLNPIKALSQIMKLYKIYSREQPRLVHHIAMKPIFLGSIAALFAKVPCTVNAFAGLGYVFNAKTPKADLIRTLLILPFRVLLKRAGAFTLFQNKDDLETLSSYGMIDHGRSHVIRGSGVDLDEYRVCEFLDLDPNLKCVFAGRMIGIKGLPTLKKAFELLEIENVNAELHLYGQPDPENPGSLTEQEINEWVAGSDNVYYEGYAQDMPKIWGNAHVAIQASYGGEGVPKSLLEAAACGKAIIATDVPGCKEVVEHGKNGLLVPSYDEGALAQAVQQLAEDPLLCKSMGEMSRSIVEEDMSSTAVQASMEAFYKSCDT